MTPFEQWKHDSYLPDPKEDTPLIRKFTQPDPQKDNLRPIEGVTERFLKHKNTQGMRLSISSRERWDDPLTGSWIEERKPFSIVSLRDPDLVILGIEDSMEWVNRNDFFPSRDQKEEITKQPENENGSTTN